MFVLMLRSSSSLSSDAVDRQREGVLSCLFTVSKTYPGGVFALCNWAGLRGWEFLAVQLLGLYASIAGSLAEVFALWVRN